MKSLKKPLQTAGLTALVVLAAGMFARAMDRNVCDNEHMYLSAAILMSKGMHLYKDFSFSQVPYLPALYQLIFRMFSVSHYLLTARVINFSAMLCASALIYLVSLRLTRNAIVATASTALWMANSISCMILVEASNYALTAALSLAAVWVFLPLFEKGYAGWRCFGAGLLLALCTGAKLYYLPLFAPFAAVIITSRPAIFKNQQQWKALILFSAGAFAGFIPLMFYIVDGMPNSRFNMLQFVPAAELQHLQMGLPSVVRPWATLRSFMEVFFTPYNILTLAGPILALASLPLVKKNRPYQFILFCAVVLFVAIMATTPVWMQYYAAPLPFFILLLSMWFVGLKKSAQQKAQIFFAFIFAVALWSSTKFLTKDLQNVVRPSTWAGIVLHNDARHIGEILTESGLRGKVATLAPLYILETGAPIYREFSTGYFLYVMGDYFSAEKRAEIVTTSPLTLDDFLTRNPPDAILLGFYPLLERPFAQFAAHNGYTAVPGFTGISLLLKPK